MKAPDHTVAVEVLMDWIEERGDQEVLTAVGHRVVHGGPKYSEPQVITVFPAVAKKVVNGTTNEGEKIEETA